MEAATNPPKGSRAKMQRTPAGQPLGACIGVNADALAFVGAGTEWLTVETKTTENSAIIVIREEHQ